MDHLRLRALALIEALGETGSLHKAARRLNVSQPALQDIPWGTKVIEYRGERISDAEAIRRIDAGADCIFELGEDQNVDGNEARYINHSRDDPNCFVLREDGRLWIVAGIEGIEAGEELTFDYGSDYFPDD